MDTWNPNEEGYPYVADPLNPTDDELTAAIKRGLADGTLIDADEWMARNAPS
jgi:hypothetical protein